MNAGTFGARVRAAFENPVLRREVRTLGRRGRFGWTVFVLTLSMTLLIASVGARAASGVHPALLGKVLFQTFFGIAQALVLFAGPAVAAGSVAGEREGRTFEALLLTGMSPVRIARGKTLAAVAHVGAYAIALAPVGALPFLFGGVPAGSALVAFVMLATETVVATLVGLAISTRLPSTRAALLTSVIAGTAMALAGHYLFGEALGDAVCAALGVPRPGTIWLPVLIAEGGPAATGAAVLGLGVLCAAAMASWFLLETCAASLADPGTDRASGLKRWFIGSVALYSIASVAGVAAVPTRVGRAGASIGAVAIYGVFAAFVALVFQGDALVAPRRLRKIWNTNGTAAWRRFLGPGLNASAALQLGAAAVAIGIVAAAGVAFSLADDFGPATAPLGIVAAALPAGAFVLFVVGVASLSRALWGPGAGRAIVALLLLVLAFGPYAVAAIVAGGDLGPDAAGLFAPPSPAFLFDVAVRVAMDTADASSVASAVVSGVGYAIAGLAALIVASVRVDKIVALSEAEATRVDALLAEEDAGRSPPPRTSIAPPGPFPLAPRTSQPPEAPFAASTTPGVGAPEPIAATRELPVAPHEEISSAREIPEPPRRAESPAPTTATFASPPSAATTARNDAAAASVLPAQTSVTSARRVPVVNYQPRESPFASPPQIAVERPPPRPRVDDDEERIAERAIPVDMDLIPEPDPREERAKKGSGPRGGGGA